jgi:hypothetical protein
MQWYVTFVNRGSLYEKFGNKCVKILKFWRTELSYAQNKNRGRKMRLLGMDTIFFSPLPAKTEEDYSFRFRPSVRHIKILSCPDFFFTSFDILTWYFPRLTEVTYHCINFNDRVRKVPYLNFWNFSDPIFEVNAVVRHFRQPWVLIRKIWK